MVYQLYDLNDEGILESKSLDSTHNTKDLESKIDKLVHKLYNLTDEEIQIIES